MGNEMSTADATVPLDENSVSGLLPFDSIQSKCFIIENLVFASGGVNVYAYAGAVRFLEKSLPLQRIRRFSGVGAGGIVASLLALGYNSQTLQELFDKAFDSLTTDELNSNENTLDKMISYFGSNTGSNFLDWFANVLENKSYDADLTFSTLYEETQKELCIVVTNIDKAKLEYFHPKTTPNFSIRRAVLASMAIPGMFAPLKFGLGTENYHYVHGGLINRFPIDSFDGWWLSMDKNDSFVRKCDCLSTLDTVHSSSFFARTARTLGFFLIDKYDEKKYNEFIDRLRHCGANMTIPGSNAGEAYKTYWNERVCTSRSYNQLRGVCLQLMHVAKSCENDGRISMEDLAYKITSNKYFSESERLLISPECGQTKDTCLNFLKGLNTDGNLTSEELMAFINRRVLVLLEKYPCFPTAITDMRSYFRSVFEVQQKSGENIAYTDYNRTVGIFCGHVSSSDRLSAVDREFLYRQGWNATAVHLQDLGVSQV